VCGARGAIAECPPLKYATDINYADVSSLKYVPAVVVYFDIIVIYCFIIASHSGFMDKRLLLLCGVFRCTSNRGEIVLGFKLLRHVLCIQIVMRFSEVSITVLMCSALPMNEVLEIVYQYCA